MVESKPGVTFRKGEEGRRDWGSRGRTGDRTQSRNITTKILITSISFIDTGVSRSLDEYGKSSKIEEPYSGDTGNQLGVKFNL